MCNKIKADKKLLMIAEPFNEINLLLQLKKKKTTL